MQLLQRSKLAGVVLLVIAIFSLSAASCNGDKDILNLAAVGLANLPCGNAEERKTIEKRIDAAESRLKTAQAKVDAEIKEAGDSRSDQDDFKIKEAEGPRDAVKKEVDSLKSSLGKCDTSSTSSSTSTTAAKASATSSTQSTAAPATTVPTCPPAPVAETKELEPNAATAPTLMAIYKGFKPDQLALGVKEVKYDPNVFTAGEYSFNHNGYIPKTRKEFVESFNTPGTRAALQKDVLVKMIEAHYRDKFTKAGCTGPLLDERFKQAMEIEKKRMEDEKSYFPIQIKIPGSAQGIDYTDGVTIYPNDDGERALPAGDIQYAYLTNDGDYVKDTLLRHACKNRHTGVITPVPDGTKPPAKRVDQPPQKLLDKIGQTGVNNATGTTMPRVLDQDSPGINNAGEVANAPVANVDEPDNQPTGSVDDNIPAGAAPRTPTAGPVNPVPAAPSPVTCGSNQEMNKSGQCVAKVNTSTSVVKPVPVPTSTTKVPSGSTSSTSSTSTTRESTSPVRPGA